MKYTFLLMICLVTASSFAAIPSENIKKAEAYVASAFADSHYAGMSIVAVQGDRVLFHEGYGYENVITQKPMTSASSSAIGSLTKSFTAFAIMRLVEEGMLDLDEPIVTYLPWFKTARKEQSDLITLRFLLSNRSGLSSLDPDFLGADLSDQAEERFVRKLASNILVRKPGTAFEYANEGFVVAGLVASTVAEMSYPELIDHYVLKPLNMVRSTSDHHLFDALQVLHGHYPGYDRHIPVAHLNLSRSYAAAGSLLRCSALDMGNYLRVLLQDGSFEGKRLLQKESIQQLWHPEVVLPQTKKDSRPSFYGLGWSIDNYEGRDVITHGGNAMTMTSLAVLDPNQKTGVVLLSNSGSVDGYANIKHKTICNNVLRILDGLAPSSYGQPTEPDRTLNDFDLDPRLFSKYEGSFQSTGFSGVWASMKQTDKGLLLQVWRGDQCENEGLLDFMSPVRAAMRSWASTQVVQFKSSLDGSIHGFNFQGATFYRLSEKVTLRKHESNKLHFSISKEWQVAWEGEQFIARKDDMIIRGNFADQLASVKGAMKASGKLNQTLGGRFWESQSYMIQTEEGLRQRRDFYSSADGCHLSFISEPKNATKLMQQGGINVLRSMQHLRAYSGR